MLKIDRTKNFYKRFKKFPTFLKPTAIALATKLMATALPHANMIDGLLATLNTLGDLHLLRTKLEVKSMKRENSLPWHSNPMRAISKASLNISHVDKIIRRKIKIMCMCQKDRAGHATTFLLRRNCQRNKFHTFRVATTC